MFLFHDNIVEIKEKVTFSYNLVSIYSKEFNEPIYLAVGYQNRILVSLKTRLEELILSKTDIEITEEHEPTKFYSYKYPASEKSPEKIEFLNKGKSVLVCFKEALYLLTEKLNLLNIYRFKEQNYSIHVPTKKGKSFITYSSNEIKILRINTSQDIKLLSDKKIDHVCTTNFNNSPQIVYSDDSGQIFLRKKLLKIRCEGKF